MKVSRISVFFVSSLLTERRTQKYRGFRNSTCNLMWDLGTCGFCRDFRIQTRLPPIAIADSRSRRSS